FAITGIDSLLTGGGIQYVAEVNGERISAADVQLQVNQQKRRLLMSMGEDIDPSMLDDQLLAGPALEFMIQKSLMMQAARDYGLEIPEQLLVDFIGDMEVFKIDGQFDPVRFRQIVSDQGYTPAGFQRALREDLVVTQMRLGLAGSTFATGQDIERLARIEQEQRDLRYMVLPLAKFRTDAEITDADVAAWYEENQQQYMTEETVTLAYIELTRDDFLAPVDEARLREVFEAEQSAYQRPEERRVSHILITPGDDDDDAAVLARVAAAQARLDAGEDFSAVASELSDDVGSATVGGDLGFTDGTFFPEEMEAAIAELGVDEISAPVETDAGFHLIKLTELRAGESLSFEEVRAELEERLAADEASRKLVKTVEELRDLAFNAEGLAEPAAQLELQVERSGPIGRNHSEGLFADPRLIAAAYSSDVIEEGYNSEVVEIDTEHFVVLRVEEHKLPELQPLEEVREGIIAALRDEAARANIRATATELLSTLRTEEGASIESLAQQGGYEWQVELATTRNNPAVPDSLLNRAFQLPTPAEGQTTFEYVQNEEGDIELFELVKVIPGQPDTINEGQRRLIERQLIGEYGRQADEYFQQQLRSEADITRS
ncbi:MAG: SurA N-terminal domain-containing protein, partial [Halieaceae bacterium]|nr:SurA N-terminal domain-containing protein [Halieaceae bacterium]